MTIINFAVQHERAIVAADSVCCTAAGAIFYTHDGQLLIDHKLVALPHARCVLAMLGSMELRRRLLGSSNLLPDTDTAIERIPAILRAAWPESRTLHPAGFRYSSDSVAILVGWSESRGRMLGATFGSKRDFEPQLHGADDGGFKTNGTVTSWFIDPGISLTGRFPDETPAGMFELAQMQARHFRASDPDVPLGGPVIVAELTRDRVVLGIAGDLGVPATTTAVEGVPVSAMHIVQGAVTEYVTEGDSFQGSTWTNAASNYNPQGTFPAVSFTLPGNIGLTHAERQSYKVDISVNSDLRAHSSSVASINCTLRLVYRDLTASGDAVALQTMTIHQPTFVPGGASGQRHIKVQVSLTAKHDFSFGLTLGHVYQWGLYFSDIIAYDSSGTQVAPGASSDVNLGGHARLLVAKA